MFLIKKKHKVKCQFCGSEAKLVGGERIYPHRPDLYSKRFYFCDNGHDAAYVGAHAGSNKPLGTLADEQTRYWRSKAHEAFDPQWKHGSASRNEAYKVLATKLKIDKSKCHIGMFDIDMCKKVINLHGGDV